VFDHLTDDVARDVAGAELTESSTDREVAATQIDHVGLAAAGGEKGADAFDVSVDDT
jgi:hypothetical protein